MSNLSALIFLVLGAAAHFLLPSTYGSYILLGSGVAAVYFLATKIDDLRRDLDQAEKDIKELKATTREPDLDCRHY